MPNKKTVFFCDSLLVLLNISSSYSIIPYLIFFQYHRGINTGIIIIIDVIYLLWRFGKHIKMPKDSLFTLYFILNLFNVFSSIITSTGSFMPWLYLGLNTLFYFLLYNLYYEYRNIESQYRALWLVLRGYMWLCAICLVSAFLLFLFIKLGVNVHINDVGSRMDLFEDNVNTLGHSYYFPYYLSILLVSANPSLKLPFFTEHGVVCGIYFEPHIITFMLFPALFILYAYANSKIKKFFLISAWLLLMLMACSTTNIVASLFCLFVSLFFDKTGRYYLIPILAIFLILIFYVGLSNTEFFFVAEKLEDSGGSKGYSMNTISFAFTPQTLLGTNFLNNRYLNEIKTVNNDVGYISFILNIIFLLLFVYRICKLIFSNKYYRLLGISVLYFFLHSMKIAMVTYSLSFLMLMIFIVSVAGKSEKYKL